MPADAIVHLPGLMCDARLWAPQVASLPYAAVHADTTRADNFEQMALELGPDVFQRQSAALGDRADNVPALASIDCPVRVARGIEDKLCPPQFHDLMASEIPGARPCVIDVCGHLASLDCPDIVNRELQALLEQ